MDKEHFSKLLIKQQERGNTLLSLISNMHESQNDLGEGMPLFGIEDLYYVPEEELEEFKNKFAQWKSYVHELLQKQFGRDDQYVYDWDTYVAITVSKREPILPQLKKKVNKGLSLIDSFLERLDIHFHDNGNVVEKMEKEKIAKSTKVFISHASKDAPFIEPFKNIILKEALGLQDNNIICTSFESTGVPPGVNIPQYIKDNIEQAPVFFAMISNNYKKSEVCMNEVGAAWALGKTPIQIVLPGVEFDKLGWLIHLDKAAKIDNGDSLDHLAEVICNSLGKPMITPVHWNTPRKQFLEAIALASDTVAIQNQPCCLCFQDGSQEFTIHPKLVATYYSAPTPKVQPQNRKAYSVSDLMSFGSAALNAVAAQYSPKQQAQATVQKPISRETNHAICQVQLRFNNCGDALESVKVSIKADNGIRFCESNYKNTGIELINIIAHSEYYSIDDARYWCNAGDVNAESSKGMPLLYVELPFLYKQYDNYPIYEDCYPKQIILPYEISTKHKRFKGSLTINVEPEFEEDYAESKTLDGKLVIGPKIEKV
ncbi:MAG: toll/interleukin-1 receptor domain-containing protein [Bacteroidaceae bacterium]|nr:toll/interleukin-1 receptor domain-containing protein [Bacteroidaceae bacterium]